MPQLSQLRHHYLEQPMIPNKMEERDVYVFAASYSYNLYYIWKEGKFSKNTYDELLGWYNGRRFKIRNLHFKIPPNCNVSCARPLSKKELTKLEDDWTEINWAVGLA